MIPFANFEPDRIKYAGQSSVNVSNCLPVADGWGPLPDLTVISEALADTCVGAWSVRKQDGSYRLIAGTRSALYQLDATDFSWDDISGASAPFDVPVGDKWSATLFGRFLILANINDDIQYLEVDTGTTFAVLPGSPPRARYVATVGEYVAIGYLDGYPNRYMQSGLGDAGFWTVGQRGCDYQDFANGEEIMSIMGGERGAIIAHRQAFTSVALTAGGDYSFTTALVNQSRGVIAPLSVVPIGPGQFLYYSQDGFFSGVEGSPIGSERVDRWFYDRIDTLYVPEIRGFADPFRKIAWWQAQEPTGVKFLLGYNWQLNRWCFADNNVSEMCIMATPGVTWDGVEVLFDTWDDADIPWDSALLTGGALRFAAFDTSNRLGFFTGAPRAASIDTADIQLTPGRRSWLAEARVVTDSPTFTLRAITSDYHGGTRTVGNAVTPFSRTGICHFRSSALMHALRMEIPASVDWKHASGIDGLVVAPEGTA